jgi:hypothetical protein
MLVISIFNQVNLNSVHFQSIPSFCCINFPGKNLNMSAVYDILVLIVIPEITARYIWYPENKYVHKLVALLNPTWAGKSRTIASTSCSSSFMPYECVGHWIWIYVILTNTRTTQNFILPTPVFLLSRSPVIFMNSLTFRISPNLL